MLDMQSGALKSGNISKNYKNLLTSLKNYNFAKTNNDFPLCIKKLSEIERGISDVYGNFRKLIKNDDLKLNKLNEILNYVQQERSKSDFLEQKIIRDTGLNIENDFKKSGFKIQGDLDRGIKVKNFLLQYDKKNFKIIIYYLFQKEKFTKINGLNNVKAVELIENFYNKLEFQNEHLEKSVEKIFSIYSNLSITKNSSKIRILEVLEEFYAMNNINKKSQSEKRIEFSFILYKIQSLMIKTSNGKSVKLDWATGENIIDKNKQIDVPDSDNTTISKNISFMEFY